MQQYLTVDRTEEAYVFRIDPQTSAEATELWAAVSDDEEIPADTITNLTIEYRLDTQLYRPAGISMHLRFEECDSFKTLDMTVAEDVVSYGEPVEVDVPEEVREND